MTRHGPFDIRHLTFEHRGGLWHVLDVGAQPTFIERIVPPAGEAHAFEVQHHRRHVEVYVSPTGRSVRVFVDGQEVRR